MCVVCSANRRVTEVGTSFLSVIPELETLSLYFIWTWASLQFLLPLFHLFLIYLMKISVNLLFFNRKNIIDILASWVSQNSTEHYCRIHNFLSLVCLWGIMRLLIWRDPFENWLSSQLRHDWTKYLDKELECSAHCHSY